MGGSERPKINHNRNTTEQTDDTTHKRTNPYRVNDRFRFGDGNDGPYNDAHGTVESASILQNKERREKRRGERGNGESGKSYRTRNANKNRVSTVGSMRGGVTTKENK